MYYGEASGFLGVFFEKDDGCVGTVCGEVGDFAQREFVPVAVGGTRDVGAVWEESAEEMGFVVER